MYEQPYNPYAKNLAVVKEYFRTPVTLLVGIFRAVAAILTAVSGIIFATQIDHIIYVFRSLLMQIASVVRIPTDLIQEIFDAAKDGQPAVSASVISSSVLSLVVPGLIITGFLILYFKSRSTNPLSSPKAGVTILYIFAILEMIGAIIASVVMILGIVALFWLYFQMRAGAFGSVGMTMVNPFDGSRISLGFTPEILLAVIIALIIVFAVAIFLLLFVTINKKRFYGSIRTSITSVELHAEGAKPYGVMCILGGISTGLSSLSLLSGLFTDQLIGGIPGSFKVCIIISFLASVASCVALILEAKLALGYKRHIDDVKYGYSRHAAPAAPYAPFPAGAGYVNAQSQPQNNPYSKTQSEEPASNAYADPYGADAPAPAEPAAPVIPQEPVIEEPAVEAASTCPYCGEEVDTSAPFCGNCGHKL